MTASVSVVIVSYRAKEDLRRCLESLQSDGAEILQTIVFDNGSADGTSEMVEGQFPGVELMSSPENIGLTKGVNLACRRARGEFICLLDADTVVLPGALQELRLFLQGHSEAGIAAGRMLNPDGTIQETARSFPTILNSVLGRQSYLSRWFPNNRWTREYLRSADKERTDPFAVGWVAAACMMFRRSLLESVGWMDEDYFVYWVDADWCMRAQRKGYQVWCVPAARIYHIEQNRKGKKKTERGIRSFHEGALLFYRKHYVGSSWSPMYWVARAGLRLRCEALVAANRYLR
jgi:N-acetylglucosaminyl-diphospho-decaprenol L-rhamnosyltransferase